MAQKDPRVPPTPRAEATRRLLEVKNLHETARELALAWIAADQWGDPNCSDAYEKFFLDEAKCPEELADALIIKRADLIVVRAYASRLVGQTRRMMAGAVLVEEDGA